MKTTDFLSDRTYVVLPTKSNPKVYLPFGRPDVVKKAFKLYNPFSAKAKILKGLSQFFCLYLKPLARTLLPTIQGKKSKFLVFLEKKLSKKIISAVYVATAKDKVVLQLQDPSGIVGYLKYPISGTGEKRLLNEQRAITLLSKKNLIPPLLLKENFGETPFIMLQNLNGTIGEVSSRECKMLLERFKKPGKHTLKNHPRILGLKEKLRALGLSESEDLLERCVGSSSDLYHEAYEHGDFAAWNLIKTDDGLIPFDFEYFEENGLVYLDEIKFHFQEQHLLHHKQGRKLIKTIETEISIKEFSTIFTIFLIKEIVIKAGEKESYNLENNLLALINQ